MAVLGGSPNYPQLIIAQDTLSWLWRAEQVRDVDPLARGGSQPVYVPVKRPAEKPPRINPCLPRRARAAIRNLFEHADDVATDDVAYWPGSPPGDISRRISWLTT